MSLTLSPLARSDIGRVMHLELPKAQQDFVGTIGDMASDPDPLQDFHIALDGSTVVGFFKIYRDFNRRIAWLPERAHGMRGVLIGGQYQRQGLGRQMFRILPTYLSDQYEIKEFWLSVDQANSVATDLYSEAGWKIEGPPFQGRSGPEWVMRLVLAQ